MLLSRGVRVGIGLVMRWQQVIVLLIQWRKLFNQAAQTCDAYSEDVVQFAYLAPVQYICFVEVN